MKIVCQKCTAPYEVQEDLIPPSGLMMRCPACLHTFPVKPPAGRPREPLSLDHGEDEFTPPGARAAASPAPAASSPPRASLAIPPAGGMVSPVRPSVHDTAHDAELPAPKQRAPGTRLPGTPDPGRRTEAADLPAPKRAVPSKTPAPPREAGAPPSIGVPPPPRDAPVVSTGGRPSAPLSIPPNLADLAGPLGLEPAADLPAPVGRRSARSNIPADLPAPVGRPRTGVTNLPAPVGSAGRHRPSAVPPFSPPASAAPPSAAVDSGPEMMELDLALKEPAELPVPVEAHLPAPVEAELLAPVNAELLAPVNADLLTPVMPDLVDTLEGGRGGGLSPDLGLDDGLGMELDDLPPPPPRSGSAQRSGAPFGQAVGSVPPTLDTVSSVPQKGSSPELALDLDQDAPRPGGLASRISRSAVPVGPSLRGESGPLSRRSGAAPPRRASYIEPSDEVANELTQPIPQEIRESIPSPAGPVDHDAELEAQVLALSGDPGPQEHDEFAELGIGPESEGPESPEVRELDDDALAVPAVAAPLPEPAKHPPRSRKKLIFFGAVGAAVLLVGSVSYFYFFAHRRSTGDAADFNRAQLLLGDEMLPSYRKAADRFHSLVSKKPEDEDALGMEALARLSLARYGIAAEQRTGEERLNQVGKDHKTPSVQEARALRDLLANKTADARKTLEPLVQSASARKDFLAPVYLGWVELRAGKSAAAEKAFRISLRISPQLPAALYGIAQVHEREGDRETALADYGKVLKARPAHFGAALGQVRTGPGSLDEAKLTDVINKGKASASPRELGDAWTQLGALALSGGGSRRAEAEDRFRKALAADPAQTVAQVGLASMLCDKDRYQEASELAQKAVKNEPANVEAWLVMARALLGLKKPLDAGAPLLQLVKLAPKDARVHYWQGRREEDSAAPDSDSKAAVDYQKALELNPRYLDAYIALSRVLARQNKTTDAMAALKQAAEQTQDDPDMANSLGEAYLAVNENDKAEEAFRLALRKKPSLLRARMNLGLALLHKDRLEAAAEALALVASADKDYPGLSERRAEVLLRQGKYPEAEKMYLQAAAQPGSSEQLRIDAAACVLSSRPKEAEAILEKVLVEDPRSARAHAMMASLKLAENNLAEAATHGDVAYRAGDQTEVMLVRAKILLAQNRRVEGLAALVAAKKPPFEGQAMALHAQQIVNSSPKDALAEVTDLLARQKTLFADRAVYRPGDIAEILGGAYLIKGQICTLNQQDAEALLAFEAAVRELPKSGEAAFQYGRALYQAGKRPAANQQLLRALSLGGDKAAYALETYLLLGDSYREMHKKAEALRAYHQWIILAPATAPEKKEVDRYLRLLEDAHTR